jgi:uncharacterized membrane-anchored protein
MRLLHDLAIFSGRLLIDFEVAMLDRSRLTAAAVMAALFFALPARADIPPPSESAAPADVADPAAQGASSSAVDEPAIGDDGANASAEPEADPAAAKAASLVRRDGAIDLPGGQARIAISEGFAFLDEKDSKTLLVDLWGNPPGAVDNVLGTIIPTDVDILSDQSWAAIITYDNEGHVSDDDASSIDYDDLLKDMQSDTASSNDQRVKAGYEAISLVGWAQKPSYDAAGHKLYWAKHLQFGENSHTLNYAIRALGRTGVLQVNVVGGMDQLPAINAKVPTLLKMVSFNEGNRYADYQEGTDPVAAYGLAALVAGGVAAKAGLFKGLLVLLAAGWKFIAIGVAAVGGMIWRMFSGRKSV